MVEYRHYPQGRQSERVAKIENGVILGTWKVGDIVVFDDGGNAAKVGMIVAFTVGVGLNNITVSIKQPGGHVRERNLPHDEQKMQLHKIDPDDARAIRSLYK